MDWLDVARLGKYYYASRQGWWYWKHIAEMKDGEIMPFYRWEIDREDKLWVARTMRKIRQPGTNIVGPLIVWEK